MCDGTNWRNVAGFIFVASNLCCGLAGVVCGFRPNRYLATVGECDDVCHLKNVKMMIRKIGRSEWPNMNPVAANAINCQLLMMERIATRIGWMLMVMNGFILLS